MQLVLIVEDDVLARAAMSRALRKLPAIEVIEAAGVAEATQLIRSLRIDLIVADIELRDGTVLEVLPHVDARGIPVVLVSGHVAEFAERLPSGLPIYAKPMTPGQLGEIVTSALGCGDPRDGFALADYVQLAALGHHSVALEVARDGEPLGAVVIAHGEVWSACDADGEGDAALIRLLGDPDVTTSCGPAPRNPGPRNLHGSSQRALLEAARVLDERRAAGVPLAEGSVELRRVVAQVAPAIAVTASRPHRQAAPDAGAEFERLYALGVEAMLTKRYRDAFETLSRARELRTTASIEANLKRLRELGVA
jgi:CheY-like chemotaxis protein